MRSKNSISLNPAEFSVLAANLARQGRADLFLSGSGYPGETKNMIGLDVRDELIVTETTNRDHIAEFCFKTPEPTFGCLSYSYGRKTQGIRLNKTTDFPHGHLKKYSTILTYHDNMLSVTNTPSATETASIEDVIDRNRVSDGSIFDLSTLKTGQIRQSLGREEYINGVRKTLDYIKNGYIYQLNLTIKYSARIENLDSVGLFMHLWQDHPAPFYAYFSSGNYDLISTSPERFLKVENGQVLTQPIKGTLAFDEYSPEIVSQLVDSPKEAAELSMIVDMLRNDISLNCQFGSVTVDNTNRPLSSINCCKCIPTSGES